MLEGLGFTNVQAQWLTNSFRTVYVRNSKGITKTYRVRVDWHYCRKLLRAGATHRQIYDILT
jgi:hypothetical protein